MKKQILTMFTCLFIGAIITGGASAYTAGILAERSTNRIYVNGQKVQMEAYTVNGNNYVKLRDIGKAVGFEVYWDSTNGCVQVESGKPYTNALRKENGVAVLRVNDKLMQAAQVRANEMATHTVYSHTRPDGRKFNTATDCPYMAENIHRIADWVLSDQTLAERAVADWYATTVHHKNMVNPKLSEIGVGLARGVNDTGDPCWYCVQLFLYDGYSITRVDTPANK